MIARRLNALKLTYGEADQKDMQRSFYREFKAYATRFAYLWAGWLTGLCTIATFYKERQEDVPEAKAGDLLEGDNVIETENELEDAKPVRMLNNFVIFRALADKRLQLVRLDDLDQLDMSRKLTAAGNVRPLPEIDEDEGQEDELEDESEKDQGIVRLRLGGIMHYWTDFTENASPVWIETKHAWYILERPSRAYEQLYKGFLKPVRIAQFVIASLLSDSQKIKGNNKRPMRLDELQADLRDQSTSDCQYHKEDLIDNMSIFSTALDTLNKEDYLLLQGHPTFKQRIMPLAKHIRRTDNVLRGPPLHARSGCGRIANPDLAVLRKDKQLPIHVTPTIYQYSIGYFKEDLVVVGPQPPQPKQGLSQQDARKRVLDLLKKRMKPPAIEFIRASKKGNRYGEIRANGVTYRPDDCILMLAGPDRKRAAPKVPNDLESIPPDACLADFFWFAKLLYISADHDIIHVQWYEASSKTVMGEINDPQELFLLELCENRSVTEIRGQVKVHDSALNIAPFDYYCKCAYDPVLAIYRDIKPPVPSSVVECVVCASVLELQHEQAVNKLGTTGISWHGNKYHCHDFVKIKAEAQSDKVPGPCRLGQIQSISVTSGADATLTVKLLGRTAMLTILPSDQITVADLISPCSVLHKDAPKNLWNWLSRSPDHFFVCSRFPKTEPKFWADRKSIGYRDVTQCGICFADRKATLDLEDAFIKSMTRRNPLAIFDPFAGLGALGRGLEEGAGCVKVTHAVEISPSASETLRLNSQGCKVYNQDSNKILEYAIKSHAGHDTEALFSAFDGERMPTPPRPGEINCIAAGFPCQPHSRLNMFKSAKDRKVSR
ncbi:hypothetical protein HWV62_20924 [Athelia sp. TMB]|nr:hypothetical protein HWV62_20924 [Athelia sp. TMB]